MVEHLLVAEYPPHAMHGVSSYGMGTCVVWIHTCIVSCCHGYFILLLGNKTCNCVCTLHVWLQLRAADSPDHKGTWGHTTIVFISRKQNRVNPWIIEHGGVG